MLSLSVSQLLRDELARSLQSQTTVALCWQLGRQASTPSTAFFIGYQAAIRCLDLSLPTDEWAAVAISETGVKSLFEIKTTYQSQRLVGNKSHVMLANSGVDQIYVLARATEDLALLKIAASQVEVIGQNRQMIMPEVPHYQIAFDLEIQPAQVFCVNAHEAVNKPFRYWEDVHVSIAMAGWLQAKLKANNEGLEVAVQQLSREFIQHSQYFSLESLIALEQLLAFMEKTAENLQGEDKIAWQRDAMLLKFTQPIRDKIKNKLLS